MSEFSIQCADYKTAKLAHLNFAFVILLAVHKTSFNDDPCVWKNELIASVLAWVTLTLIWIIFNRVDFFFRRSSSMPSIELIYVLSFIMSDHRSTLQTLARTHLQTFSAKKAEGILDFCFHQNLFSVYFHSWNAELTFIAAFDVLFRLAWPWSPDLCAFNHMTIFFVLFKLTDNFSDLNFKTTKQKLWMLIINDWKLSAASSLQALEILHQSLSQVQFNHHSHKRSFLRTKKNIKKKDCRTCFRQASRG